MEPYLIICNSCAARLKVTNEALIGQRLACPQCRSMIDVEAPAGYVPSPNSKSGITELPKGNSLSGNFEDIDSLLAKESQQPQKSVDQAAQKSKRKRFKNAPSTPAPPNPVTARGQSQNEASSIPDSQWDSETARRKKKVLQIVMASIAAVGIVGLGTWAIFGGGDNTDIASVVDPSDQSNQNDDQPAATNSDGPSTPSNIDPTETETKESEDTTPQSNTETTPAVPTAPADPLPLAPVPDLENSAQDSDAPPLDSAPATTPPAIPTAPISPLLPDTGDKPIDSPNGDDLTNVGDAAPQPTEEKDDPESPLIASTENSLGTLSEILKGQGTSLKQIEDIAEIQKERAMIGTPSYLIERPYRKSVDLQRQLSAELSGWSLDAIPLIDAISDIGLLSDVPITIDPDVLNNRKFDLRRPVTIPKTEPQSFQKALQALVAVDGLTVVQKQNGVLITTPAEASVVSRTYPQNFCTDAKSAGRLKELIIAVTGISDWDDDQKFQLKVSTDAVTVIHFAKEQQTIEALMKKLSAAANYKQDPGTLKESLKPLVLQAQTTLKASPDLKTANPYRRTMRLEDFFRMIHKQTKLNTIIDWEHLADDGWYPNTRVPGSLDEPTNQKLLDQLGHAMELAAVVVAPDTVMLTTFKRAGERNDIEVYSVGDVIDNKMTPAQLDQLLTETLGVDQLTPPNAVVIYFAECKCLVAHAPQIIQRQISSIVDEL